MIEIAIHSPCGSFRARAAGLAVFSPPCAHFLDSDDSTAYTGGTGNIENQTF
jgi:hypothetical protein